MGLYAVVQRYLIVFVEKTYHVHEYVEEDYVTIKRGGRGRELDLLNEKYNGAVEELACYMLISARHF